MRTHGVTDFPDPIAPGSTPPGNKTTYLGNGPNPNSPTYQAASAACNKYAVAQPVTPEVAEQFLAEQLKYARCMRAHGEPDFPDPSSGGGFTIPSSIDQNSPTFRAAATACKQFQPSLPGSNGS